MNRFLSIALLALLGLGVTAPGTAHADPPKAGKAQVKQGKAKANQTGTVNVQLMVVHAKEGDAYVDPRLKALEPHLEFLRYERFEVLTSESARLAGKPATFQVEGGRKVTVSVLSKDDKRVRLKVQMYKADKKLVDTTVSVNRGGTFVVAGPKFQGGMLLLPLTAEY